ncbi:MAG: PQQ-binding-like beta-propeller repeat protein [Calditrichota bacterium]
MSLLGAFLTPAQGQTVLAVYDIPSFSSGLACDGNYIWIGGMGPKGGWIRAFDPNLGEIVDSIRAPVPDCLGLAWLNDRLIYLSPRSDTTYMVSRNGFTPLFTNPMKNLGGLASDNGDLWSATYSDPRGALLKIDKSGRVIRSLPFSGRHSRDMAFHRGRVFVADRLTHEIHSANPETGRFINTLRSPGINPDGLTSDGEYLWLSDDGDEKSLDKLYKIWVRPDGNIRLSALDHNYGSVVINGTKTWTLWVYNDGARPAQRVRLESREGNEDLFVPHVWAFPEVIQPGDSAGLRITFQPAYQDSVHIEYGLTYDLDRETYWVDVRGKGVRPRRDILVSPRQLDFGLTRYGYGVRSSNLQYLMVENNGGEPLTIRELNFSQPYFFCGFYDFPHTFDEPGLYPLPIFFRPDHTGNYQETMTIVSDDPDSPQIQISLTGQSRLESPSGGTKLWQTGLGEANDFVPRIRSIIGIDDVTGDGLADVVIASNDYAIKAFHAGATDIASYIWAYTTNANPWRSGLVAGPRGMSEGGDWDGDGVKDIAVGLDGGAMQVIALSGRTGEEIWMFDTHGMRGSGGRVVIAQGDADFNGDRVRDVYAAAAWASDQQTTNAVFMLDGRNGRMIWSVQTDGAPQNVSRINDVTGDDVPDLIALCDNGEAIGIDGRRGRIIWHSEVTGDHRSSFSFPDSLPDVNGDGSQDYGVITYTHGIWVINGSNGVLLWNNRVHDRLLVGCPLNDLNGNGSADIVFTDRDNFVRAIDGLTSAAAWDTSVYSGTPAISIAPLPDFDGDGRWDYVVGTQGGRLYALRGRGEGGGALWSWSNVGEGHAIELLVSVRDLDGNQEADVMAAMANGNVYCFSGSYIGRNHGIGDEDISVTQPQTILMDPAYPNPFNGQITLPVKLSVPSAVQLRVVDITGRQVWTQSSGLLGAGSHRLTWDGRDARGALLPNGLYLIELQGGQARYTRPVELLK